MVLHNRLFYITQWKMFLFDITDSYINTLLPSIPIISGTAVRSFYGAHIAGDALDIHGNEVLTGSWRPENQLVGYCDLPPSYLCFYTNPLIDFTSKTISW